MMDVENTCRIALVQAEPAMFNKEAGVEKTLKLIREAARHEARLIVFPELFVPG